MTAEVETKESEPIKAVTMDKVMSPSQEELAARMRISQERVALQREQTREQLRRHVGIKLKHGCERNRCVGQHIWEQLRGYVGQQ